MQKWKVDDDAVVWTAEDGEWVPADVAQRLYDIVEGERVRYELFPPENELEFMHRDAVIAALAAADGEE